MNIGEKLKNLIGQKPLYAVLGLGLLFMCFGSFHLPETPVKSEAPAAQPAFSEEEKMENELSEFLSLVEGAGRVQVQVSLARERGKKYVYDREEEKEEITESDQQGGKRVTVTTRNKENLVRLKNGSGEEAVIAEEITPEIQGVVVAAQGAGDSAIKEKLLRAVTVFWSLPEYKVVIVQLKGE